MLRDRLRPGALAWLDAPAEDIDRTPPPLSFRREAGDEVRTQYKLSRSVILRSKTYRQQEYQTRDEESAFGAGAVPPQGNRLLMTAC